MKLVFVLASFSFYLDGEQVKQSPINKTKAWVKNIVIELNFCPFAKIPFEQNLIRFSESLETQDNLMLNYFIDELAFLELNLPEDLSNSILVFSEYKKSFEAFNQFSLFVDEFLHLENLSDTFKVVVFHPNFRFKGSNNNDRANLVGQSPYPMLHILRIAEIESAKAKYLGVKEIPFRNQKKILAISNKKWKDIIKFKQKS